MTRTVRMFCESANGTTGISRYIKSLSARLARGNGDFDFRLSCRCLHEVPDLDNFGISYSTNRLPGRIQSILRELGIGDHILYGSGDLIHEPNYVLSRATPRTKIVITVHDVGWRLDSTQYGLTDHFVREAEMAIRRADQIITPTNTVKNDVSRFFGVNGNHITVIPHGVDEIFMQPIHDTQRHTPEKYWLFVGAVTPRKNFERIVEALCNMETRLPLVVVGPNTEYLQAMTSTAEKKNVNVTLLNGISDKELLSVYSHATGLIYPSLWEGFGLPILEAAACGIPVITSNNTAMKEIGEGYAFLVSHTETAAITAALRSVLNLGEQERHSIKERGRLLSSRYSWDSSARKHHEVYQTLLNMAGQ